MSKLRTGDLFYDAQEERYNIRFDVDTFHGGLHCGECFDVLVGERWAPVRIEMTFDRQWYLVGLPETRLDGLTVRI